MEFTVRKFDLLQELMLIQGVVERKTTIPILANVLVRAEGGELGIAATDLEIGLKSVCVSKTTVPGAITLPAKRLYEIVRALPDKEINFKRGEANWVMITCGTSRFRIAGLPQDDFPTLPETKNNVGRIPADVLAKVISRTICAISTEDSKYTLSGALLVLKPGSITMVATDGHRLAHVEKTEAMEDVREEITAAIKRVAILSDERSRTVKLALSDGTMEISASHSDLGEAHETLEVDYGKDSLQVGFNFQYLLDFLTTADEPEVSFEFKDSESAAQLRAQPAGDYTYRYVVMPMRI